MKISLFSLFIWSALINNIVLIRFLGLCPFFGVSAKLKNSIFMGIAVVFVMTSSCCITHFVYYHFLLPLNLVFLRTLIFIFTIASFVQFVELYIKKTAPQLHKTFGIYLPLITTNCTILAATFLNIDYNFTFAQGIVFALGTSIGFTLAIALFSSLREQLRYSSIPKSFQGHGIVFITAGILSLIFIGFTGLAGI